MIDRLLGNLVLNLWDCGGQEAFMENYFASQRDNIFRNVEVTSFYFLVIKGDIKEDFLMLLNFFSLICLTFR